MTRVVIENPILNSPFDEPNRHFRFEDEGIANEIVEGRRTSIYFVPIAKSKKINSSMTFAIASRCGAKAAPLA
jgi:type III restriction enzyme